MKRRDILKGAGALLAAVALPFRPSAAGEVVAEFTWEAQEWVSIKPRKFGLMMFQADDGKVWAKRGIWSAMIDGEERELHIPLEAEEDYERLLPQDSICVTRDWIERNTSPMRCIDEEDARDLVSREVSKASQRRIERELAARMAT